MEAIQEFISILKKYNLTNPKAIKLPFKNFSKTHDLFQFFLTNPGADETKAALEIFQKRPNTLPFHRAKNKLMEQMTQALFLIDVKKLGQTRPQQAYYYCWKNLCAVKILIGQSAYPPAITLIKKILSRSTKFQFTSVSLECYQLLRWYYASLEGNKYLYEKYNRQYQKVRQILEAEQLAENHYTQISNIYLTDKSQRNYLSQLAKKYWTEVSLFMENCDSTRLHYLGHLINVYAFTCEGDFYGAFLACEKAIHYFNQSKYHLPYIINTFQNHQLICCIKLKDFERGRQLVELLEGKIKTGSFNWFVNRNAFFMLAMHSQNYEKAHEICRQVLSHRRYRYLPQAQAEKWTINHAYLHYLIICKHKDLLTAKPSFNHKKFLRQTPLYSKDKRGMNVPILIIQILIFLAQRNYNKVIDRMEAIQKYCSRYLRMEDTYRSNCFIKMLMIIPAANFHPKAIERKVAPLKAKLAQVPLEISPQAYELEIIPYEDLWETVMNILAK